MADDSYNVLFLCTGNSARSIFGECLIERWGEGRFRGFSAGSHPVGEVHPLALEILLSEGHATTGLRSKDWAEFAAPGAPAMDFVFTVCDKTAAEPCPNFPGQPVSAVWSVPDPVAAEGPRLIRLRAFYEAYRMLRNRVQAFTRLSIASLDRVRLEHEVSRIGLLSVPDEPSKQA